MQRDLICNLYYGEKVTQADVNLQQHGDCTVIAKVVPRTFFSVPPSDDFYFESIESNDSLVLKKTQALVTKFNSRIGGSELRSEFEVILNEAELESATALANDDIVTAKIYLTNLPYFQASTNTVITVSGQQITLLPHNGEAITNIAQIPNIKCGDVNRIKELIESVCWLCSLGSGHLSSIARVEVLRSNELVYLGLHSVDTTLNKGIRLIDNRNVTDIHQFIEHSFDTYKNLSNIYLLNNLIHMGILAKHTSYIENKILLMSTFLEVLRYHYALNVGVQKGLFTESGNNFIWASGQKTGQRASFKEILEQFCVDNNISGWQDDFKDLRNQIVHTGSVSGSDKFNRYFNLHHFCDRVLLGLLKWDQSQGFYIPVNCPSVPVPNVIGVNHVRFVR